MVELNYLVQPYQNMGDEAIKNISFNDTTFDFNATQLGALRLRCSEATVAAEGLRNHSIIM